MIVRKNVIEEDYEINPFQKDPTIWRKKSYKENKTMKFTTKATLFVVFTIFI